MGVSPYRLPVRAPRGSRQALGIYVTPPATGALLTPSRKPSPHRRMPLTSSFNSLRQPHQRDGPTSEFRGQPSDSHGGDALALSTARQTLPDIADPGRPVPPPPPNLSIHAGIDPPGWKRLIRGPLVQHERLALIIAIFSNRSEAEAVKRLCGDEAQNLVDVIYEARSHPLSPKNCSLT